MKRIGKAVGTGRRIPDHVDTQGKGGRDQVRSAIYAFDLRRGLQGYAERGTKTDEMPCPLLLSRGAHGHQADRGGGAFVRNIKSSLDASFQL